MRRVYLIGGIVSVVLGIIGIALPIMPTVPFLILAAWCFGKSNPAFEQRLLHHPHYGPHIRRWRERGAIARVGKIGATLAFAGSVTAGFWFLTWPWPLVPAGIALLSLTWIWTRPDA